MTDSRDLSLAERIRYLKREKNALNLAHNYQLGEVQDIADYIDDSLELNQMAARGTASQKNIRFKGCYR